MTDSVDTKTGSTVAMNRKNAKGLSKKNKHFAEPILVKKNHLHFCVYLTSFVWSVLIVDKLELFTSNSKLKRWPNMTIFSTFICYQ